MSTYVTLGNSHYKFPRLLNAVASCASELPKPIAVQCGHNDFQHEGIESTPFVEMSIYEGSIRDARLIIMQAGGGGVLIALKARKVPVIVPRRQALDEIVDDHQVGWGRALASTGRAVLVEDVGCLMAGVREALDRQEKLAQSEHEIALVDLVSKSLRR